jgi:hypothetical protein
MPLADFARKHEMTIPVVRYAAQRGQNIAFRHNLYLFE